MASTTHAYRLGSGGLAVSQRLKGVPVRIIDFAVPSAAMLFASDSFFTLGRINKG